MHYNEQILIFDMLYKMYFPHSHADNLLIKVFTCNEESVNSPSCWVILKC